MKVLYVEDEYGVLQEKIPEIWGIFMSPGESKKWKEIIKADYPGCKEIKELFANSPFLNVEYDFLEVLSLIESDAIEQYDLFVFDRCLRSKEQGITLEDVRKIIPKMTKSDFDYITTGEGREGDFLLKRLFYKMGDRIQNKVYFLSGFPPGDVFDENDLLQHIIYEAKILTEDNYIEKGDKKGIDRLKSIMMFDEEEMQIYEKWGNVLSHYNNLDDGWRIKAAIMSALLTKGKESDDTYYESIQFFDNLYTDFFDERIDKQNKQYYKDKSKASKEELQDLTEYKNKWYSREDVIIPRNIIETSEIIWRVRNNCAHRIEQGRNIDISGLTVLACAYVTLELTKFWQDKGWKLKHREKIKQVKK